MKKTKFVALFIVFSFNYLSSQTTSLKVFGNCTSFGEIIGKKITVKLSVDKNKCDPETGFISMEDKIYHFEQTIKSKGIQFSKFKRSLESKTVGTVHSEIFNFSGTEVEVDNVIQIARNQEIEVSNYSNKYKPKRLEDQDISAICALENAIQRAQFIAKNLGYENCELISVDDDTSSGSSASFMQLFSMLDLSDLMSGGSSYSIVGNFILY